MSRCVRAKRRDRGQDVRVPLGSTRVPRPASGEGGRGKEGVTGTFWLLPFSQTVGLQYSVWSGATLWGSELRTLSKASCRASTRCDSLWAGQSCPRGNTHRIRSERPRGWAAAPAPRGTGHQRGRGRAHGHGLRAQNKDGAEERGDATLCNGKSASCTRESPEARPGQLAPISRGGAGQQHPPRRAARVPRPVRLYLPAFSRMRSCATGSWR